MTDDAGLSATNKHTAQSQNGLAKLIATPWIYIPAIYLIAGAVEAGVLQYSTTIMYKDMGYSNSFIGLLALLNIPLLLSFLWAPYVDRWGSKRNLTIIFLFGMGLVTALIPFALYSKVMFTVTSLAAFFILSIMFTFFRISSEGYYIRILKPKQQAGFIGIKTGAIRLGIIASVAILIRMAGEINIAKNSNTLGWIWMYVILAATIFICAIYNFFFLPKPENDIALKHTGEFALLKVIKEYFKQDKVVLFIIFVMTYRFGEGLLVRMADPFFMDPVNKGGLGMDIPMLTIVKSFAGIPCTIIGGILGGWAVKKYGLKKSFVPLALLMSIPNLGYCYLAKTQSMATISLFGQLLNRDMFYVVCIESLGYGIGFSAFFYYLHALAVGQNKTSIFAISTALMGFGFYFPSAISGVLQEAFGYQTLFFLSFVLALPGIIMIKFLPLDIKTIGSSNI